MVSFALRTLRFLFMTLLLGVVLVFLLLAGGCGYMYYRYGHDLPDHEVVQDYQPKVITRLHAADGALMAEFAEERRLFIPIEQVPEHVVEAFISAEDKDFFRHGGILMAAGARIERAELDIFVPFAASANHEKNLGTTASGTTS